MNFEKMSESFSRQHKLKIDRKLIFRLTQVQKNTKSHQTTVIFLKTIDRCAFRIDLFCVNVISFSARHRHWAPFSRFPTQIEIFTQQEMNLLRACVCVAFFVLFFLCFMFVKRFALRELLSIRKFDLVLVISVVGRSALNRSCLNRNFLLAELYKTLNMQTLFVSVCLLEPIFHSISCIL